MELVELRSETRATTGKQVRQLRRQGWVPAVVYGPDLATTAIQAQERSMATAVRAAGSTLLINLFIDDAAQPYPVLAREIQRDALNDRLLHVDFYQVRLTEKVRTTPRLEFHGEPALVKSGVAVLIHNMGDIEVECLPTDLISTIPVDASGLEKMDDTILVRDLVVPPGLTLLADPEAVVASLVATRMEIEEEVVAEVVAEPVAAAPAEE